MLTGDVEGSQTERFLRDRAGQADRTVSSQMQLLCIVEGQATLLVRQQQVASHQSVSQFLRLTTQEMAASGYKSLGGISERYRRRPTIIPKRG